MNVQQVFLIAGLLLASYIVAGQDSEQRVPRGLIVSRADPIIAGQRNNLCTSRQGMTGSCHSRRQCRQGNGTASGQCGFASGICCTRTLGLNETSQLKRTILRRMDTDGGVDYNYAIMASNRRICQLRIDFRTLNIAQPVLTAATPPAAGSTYACSSEFVSVNGMRLCGHSLNQHMYVPLSQAFNPTVTIRASVSSSTSTGNWDILATQLECQPGQPTTTGTQTRSQTNSWSYTREDRPEEFDIDEYDESVRNSQSNPRSTRANDAFLVAPAGCLQYYPNVTGTVTSFNFDDTNVANHLYMPNMNYAICFHQPNNERLVMNFGSFSMSVRVPVPAPPAPPAPAPAGPDPVDDQCIWSGVQPANPNQDYLRISRLTYVQTPVTVATFYCGNSLNMRNVTYNSSPFVLQFVSDNFVDQTLNVERGFRFTYRME